VSLNNPTLSKNALPLGSAGAGVQGALLAGLGATLTVELGPGEVLRSLIVLDDAGTTLADLGASTYEAAGGRAADLVLGTHTPSSPAGARGHVRVETSLGVYSRQLWTKDPPTTGGLYAADQECQHGVAVVYVDFAGGLEDPAAGVVSLPLSILPTFSDEFFSQQEYSGNRYGNTRRNWGGAAWVEVFIDGARLAACALEKLQGVYWEVPGYGTHWLAVRLRAAQDSPHFVDLNGTVRTRQNPTVVP
jgi:hypothetical protein